MDSLAPLGVMMARVAAGALAWHRADRRSELHPEMLGFKLDRINPVSNIKNLFSLRAAARLAKS